MIELVVCGGCSRHVRRSEAECPFCRRRSAIRTAAVVAGAAALLACGKTTGESPREAAAPPPTVVEQPGPVDDNPGRAATAYGVPYVLRPDAGSNEAGVPQPPKPKPKAPSGDGGAEDRRGTK